MMRYYTFLDDSTTAGNETISGVQQNGSEFGVGISSSIQSQNISISGIATVSSLVVSGIATVGLGTTSAPSNSQLTFELTSNTNLRIKVRGSDGVLRSANLTLS